MNYDDENRIRAKGVDINEYLASRGINEAKGSVGGKTKYSSPFASDSDPSFYVYNNTNSFCCFSTGIGGDVIDLVMALDNVSFGTAINRLLGGRHEVFIKKGEQSRDKPKKFYLFEHTERNPRSIRKIRDYARSRCIYSHYKCCRIKRIVKGRWTTSPAVGFVHVDEDLVPCGVKLRSLTMTGASRFRAAGKQKFYVLDNIIDSSFSDPTLYIVESESSANSLWEHARENKVNCVIISFGSVSTIPKTLPNKYKDIKNRKIIIDYDGSEELFNKRKEKYADLNGEFIKLKLDKGEDLNSMYSDGTIKLLKLW